MKLNDLNISDAQIVEICSTTQNFKITLKDWLAKEWLITFYDTLALQDFNIVGEELSHINIECEDVLKSEVLDHFVDEDKEKYLCFNFFGVWSDKALLKVVAADDYEIVEKVSPD